MLNKFEARDLLDTDGLWYCTGVTADKYAILRELQDAHVIESYLRWRWSTEHTRRHGVDCFVSPFYSRPPWECLMVYGTISSQSSYHKLFVHAMASPLVPLRGRLSGLSSTYWCVFIIS